jgi:2,5-diketo-D-gluconate reductase A
MLYQEIAAGVSMPMLGFGTFLNIGNDCERSVAEAIRVGYRLIDTAEAYGNEEQVGNGIKTSGVDRKELFLVTKVNFKSYEHTRETVENSLRRLRTDYLDLVLLHWPFANYYAAWRELETLCAEGKIRSIGVSNFEPDRLVDLIAYNKVKPAVNQIETHLYCQRQTEHEWENKYGVAHMAYAPLGQGHANEMFAESIVQNIAAKYGKTPAQVLLRRAIQDGVTVIPKSIHAERIAENIDVFDFELSADEMTALRTLDKASPMIGNPEKPELVEMAMQW